MTTEIQLNKLRNEAFGKLKSERDQFSLVEQSKISEIIQEFEDDGKFESTEFVSITHQIYKDIRISGYKKYDCLAMWLDGQGGLAKHEPELIVKIAKEVGELKEE